MKKSLFLILIVLIISCLNVHAENLYLAGKNEYGEIGDSSNTQRSEYYQINKTSNWKQVFAGGYNTFAIKYDGTLWGWGGNGSGQLGDSTTEDKKYPVRIGKDTNWIKIESKSESTFGIKSDGTLWAWGLNTKGQLGIGTTQNKTYPVKVGNDNNWLKVSSGGSFTIAIKKDGSLWSWGTLGNGTQINSLTPVKLGSDTNWAYIYAYGTLMFAIKNNGTLWGYGFSYYKHLGNGDFSNASLLQIGTDTNWAVVGCGNFHTTALKTDGTLWAWGISSYSLLGDSSVYQSATPIQIGTQTNWAKLGWGLNFTFAIKNDSTLWAWGLNLHGQFGIGPGVDEFFQPKQIRNDSKWSYVSCGYFHSAVLDNTKPQVFSVITKQIHTISTNSAIGGGEVFEGDGELVIARGVCWSISDNPTVEDSKSVNGTGFGSFFSNISGLNENTKYYVRAYATTNDKTIYGNTLSFTTVSNLPVISTVNISEITQSSAVSGGNISDDGGSDITERGVCWSENEYPSISNNITSDGNQTGTFVSTLTKLNSNTLYYVRAYATNSNGTAYGNQVNFTTSAGLPTITTSPVSEIKTNSIVSGGNITNDGGAEVIQRGVCWSQETDPTIDDNKTSDGSGSGIFTSNITGLIPNVKYYVRAYAINSSGTAYGNQIDFVINTEQPNIVTSEITDITTNSAISGGNIFSDGSSPIIQRGICWSTNPHPTTSSSLTGNGNGTGIFTSTLLNLNHNTTYYVRAYAINSNGTFYGQELSFTTLKTTSVLNNDEFSSKIIKSITKNQNQSELIINYTLQNFSIVSMNIYNSFGVLMSEMINNQSVSNGEHLYHFNSENLPAGVYFIEIEVNGIREVHKILVM